MNLARNFFQLLELLICKGACLFLEGQFWTTACDNAFTHNLAVLAAAIYYQTQGLILTRITADGIRRDGIASVEVIDLGFVESNGDMATVAPPPLANFNQQAAVNGVAAKLNAAVKTAALFPLVNCRAFVPSLPVT